MGSSPESFDGLKSLLKLKQYERPPRQHFSGMSTEVIDRLRGPEGLRQQSLISVLGLRFGIRPALFYGLGVACCGLALYGVICMLVKDPPPETSSGLTTALTRPHHDPSQPPASLLLTSGEAAPADGGSTNPVLTPSTTTFPLNASRIRVQSGNRPTN